MTLDSHHTALGGELEELVLQVFVPGLEYEADVHAAAVFLVEDRRCEQLRLVEALIEQVCFGFVACLNPFDAAVGFQPAQGQQGSIDGQYGRGVEHRAAVNMRLVVQHRRDVTAHLSEARLLDDDERHTCRSEVLLRTAVDDVVLAHVNRSAEDVGRHVGYQGHIAFLAVDLLKFLVADLRAEDRVVRRDVEVVSVLRNLIVRRNRIRAGCYFDSLAEAFGFLQSFLRPHAGVQVRGFFLQHIERHHAELQTCAATQEQYAVTFGNVQQLFEQRFRLIYNGLEVLRAVTDLED